MKGISVFHIGIVVVFIAAFMLFFIFDSIDKLAKKCKTDPAPICQHLSSFTLSMIIVLLIIGGFVLVISVTVYILLSSQGI